MKFKEYVNESSLSRIWQFVEDDKKSFSVVSAYRSYYNNKENKKRHILLIKGVRSTGYGFIEMRGGYVETIEGVKIEVQESSVFIPSVEKKDIMKLGSDYEQDSILYKKDGLFSEIGTNDVYGVGKNVETYKMTGGDNITLAKDVIKKFYSRLKKGSHNKKKFQLKEKHDTGMSQVYHNKIDDIWINIT